ncbi:MAG: sulfotransferase family protein [Acidimicrobiales bacterium]
MQDEKQLIAQACERAQADDFGPDTWQLGLEALLRALTDEGNLNELGEAVYADQIVGLLSSRLAIEKWYADYPEIEQQEIVAPLFGIGLPRTGSTALSFLLACDQSRRSLRTWEASSPCPPPETSTEHTDPRIAICRASIEMSHQMFPDFVGMLPTSPTGPSECLLLMGLDFHSQLFQGMAILPSYTEWLMTCDMEPTYRYHKRVLKLLQWRCPPVRWSLKTPSHMTTIQGLDAVYPDARFVMTHRDISSVIPSVCAVKEALSTPLTDSFDCLALGRHEHMIWLESIRRLIEFRNDGREDRFVDASFSDMQSDPIACMENLYGQLGDDLTSDTRRRMGEWWEESAKDRRQGNRPDPTAYGLDMEVIRQDFAFYHNQFGID